MNEASYISCERISNMQGNSIVKGFVWKFLERFGVSGIQFILQIVLARLLDPSHYGVLSLMVVFTTLADVFIQGGFTTSLIQNKNVSEEDYSSVLWVSLGIAGFLYVAIFIGAPFIAEFYKMPDIVKPLRVLALMLFPGALNSVQLAKVSREMDFKKVFYSNIGGVVVSGLIGILIAYMGGGLWALVVQTLLNTVVSCLVMCVTVKLHVRFVCNLKRVGVLFSFGGKLLVSSLLETLYQDVRSLVIGKKYNSSTLGYYNRGKQFPQFITNAINGAVQSVMLSAMSAEQDDRTRVKEIMRNSMSMSAYIIFPVMAGLAVIAEPLVSLLLTDKWLPCVPYLRVYCFTFAFYPVCGCNLQAINAIGRSDLYLKLEIIKKCYGLVALIIAVVFFNSPLAIAMTALIAILIEVLVDASPNRKLLNYSYIEQMKDLMPSIALSLLMFCIVWLIGKLALTSVLKITIQIVTGVGVYLLFSELFKLRPYVLLKGICFKILSRMKYKAKENS